MGMSPRLLRPRNRVSVHPEAAAWATRVAANGGTVGSSTLAAVSKFCAAIDAANIRDRFWRLNLFCGTGLTAALVPLYRGPSFTGTQYGNTTDSNSGAGPFVSADYAESGDSGGLTGNGTSKYLDTGLVLSDAAVIPNGHIGVMRGPDSASWAGKVLIGSLNSSFTQFYQIGVSSTGLAYENYYGGALQTAGPTLSAQPAKNALIISQRTASNLGGTFFNGSYTTSSSNVTGQTPDRSLFVFARNQGTPVGYIPGTLRCYSAGTAFTTTQESAYRSALFAFFATIARTYQ